MSGQIGRFGFPSTVAFYELSRILFYSMLAHLSDKTMDE